MKVHRNWSTLDQSKYVAEAVTNILLQKPPSDISRRTGDVLYSTHTHKRNFEVNLTGGNLLVELAHREHEHREFKKRAIELLTDVYQTTRSQKVLDDISKFMYDLEREENKQKGIQ